MFLGLLTAEQKQALAVLAHRLVAADGVVVRDEWKALGALRAELRHVDPALEDLEEDQLARLFDSRRARIVALLELLRIARADDDYCLDEESLVTLVAHEMGVDAADLERVDRWVVEHLAQLERAFRLMDG